jgi:hypothetical protein
LSNSNRNAKAGWRSILESVYLNGLWNLPPTF